MEERISPPKITDKKTGMAKAQHYCAYQERSQQEVRNKLYELGLWKDAVEEIITDLIGENYLNEARFSNHYAQSKFNQKSWGRIKIKQALKFKGIPEKLIQKALASLDETTYLNRLQEILQKKADSLKESHPLKRKNKLQQYALTRGFELFLIADILNANKL